MSSVHEHPADEVCVDCKDWQTGSSSSQAQPAPADASAATKGSAQASTSASSSTSALNFEPPSVNSLQPSILIEFCDRCRWAPRATWTQTELFLTFPTPLLRSITLQPLTSPETGGRFRVWLFTSSSPQDRHLLWDRKTEGGFPELKVLKQRVRNVLQPDLNLGHSDAHGANRRLMGTDIQVTTAAGQAETSLPAKGDAQGVNTPLAAQIQ